jgi:uncharacterized protein YjbI with pentapeptide repeats
MVNPGADLSEADLRGADFSLANVTKVVFDVTYTCCYMILNVYKAKDNKKIFDINGP